MANNAIGSMLCPHCGKLISKNAETCIHCGKRNPKTMTSVPFLQRLLSGKVSYVQGIIMACITLYILSLLIDLLTGNLRFMQGGGFLNLLSPSNYSHSLFGWSGAIPVVHQGKWWSIFTAIYLHGSLLHILFNMLWVNQLGPVTEELYGSARFFAIYTIAGAFGFIASTYAYVLMHPNDPMMYGNYQHVTLGASGAIFGLFGAIVYYGRNRGGYFGDAIYRQTAQWAAVLFIFGFLFPGIDNFAHGGGFIGGYLASQMLGYQEKTRENLHHRWIAMACLGMTVLAFLLNFI
ncbi:rhomboid family intramembrane serine protease [candidate division KSB1 bacterium]|nr:rhomboid family intramembrane serine protease [candidate division KSB1 bacterium]